MDDILIDEINKKLVFAILLAIGGIVFVLKRLIVSAVEKNSALQAIKKIKRQPSYARVIADGLDMPYASREPFPFNHFEKLKEYLRSQTMIGDYQILHSAEVAANEFLVFAMISFEDFDIGITGKGTDVKRNTYLTFLVRHDYNDQRLTFQSDTYTTSTEKFQREGFFAEIFKTG